MPSANKTPNYDLTQYSNNGSDKISALKDYNEDMSKIDVALNDNANNIINKADKATTYTKIDVDEKLATKADAATTYSKTGTDGRIAQLRPPVNIADRGVPIDSIQDVSDQIQAIIEDSPNGIFVPSGIYHISKPIKTPTRTKYPFIFEASQSAHIVALNNMDCMLDVGAEGPTAGGTSERQSVHGGIWHALTKATDIIKIESSLNGVRISDMTLLGAVQSSIHFAQQGGSANSVVANITINAWDEGRDQESQYGVLCDSGDWSIANCNINYVHTGIKTEGYAQVNNIHVWSNQGVGTTGIIVHNGGILNSVYLDGMETGITTKRDDGTLAGGDLIVDGLYHYCLSSPLRVSVETQTYQSQVKMSNIQQRHKPDDENAIIWRTGDNWKSDRWRFGDSGQFFNVDHPTHTPDTTMYGSWDTTRTWTLTGFHSHKAGEGIALAYLPDNLNHNYAQRFALFSCNTNLSLDRTFEINTDNARIAKSESGLYEGLFFGVSAKSVTLDGDQYHILYLYNADASLGTISPTDICAYGHSTVDNTSNALLFNSTPTWITGLTNDAMMATLKS